MFALSSLRPMRNLVLHSRHFSSVLTLSSPSCQEQSQCFPAYRHQLINPRLLSSVSYVEKKGIFERVKTSIKNRISDKTKVTRAGALAYEKIADEVNYTQFLKFFQLPDTFQSWFLSVQLHVWMCMLVAVNQRNGRMFRNLLVDAMWNDVEFRIEKLAELKSSKKKKYLQELTSQFQCAIISYDEGILCDDKTLAASAWRTLFTFQHVDPQLLENIVAYIRIQLAHLDTQQPYEIVYEGKVNFKPLDSIFPHVQKH